MPNDGSFVHSAYALGIGDPESPARQKLLDVTTALGDIEKAAGAANLGPDEPFVPTTYRFQARVVDPTELDVQDPAPTVVDWPAATGVVAGRRDRNAPGSTPLRSGRCSPTPSRTRTSRTATSCTSCPWQACCPAIPPADGSDGVLLS